MRSLKVFALSVLIVALVVSAVSAGDWTVVGSYGAGRRVHGGRLPPPGFPIHQPYYPGYRPWYPTYHPWYPVHPYPVYGPSSWVFLSDDGWSVGWTSGYGYGYGYVPPGTRFDVRRPPLAYAPVVGPYGVGTVRVISGRTYATSSSAAPPPPRGDGIFMAPVGPLPKTSGAQDSDVRAALPQPSAGTDRSDLPPPATRRSLDAVSRIYRMGGVERAETDLGKLLRANPSDAAICCNYAYVLFLREKYATAGYCLRRAIVLDETIARTGAAGVSGFHDAKASADGLVRLDKYLESQPRDASARLVRGWVLYLDGKTDDARAEFDRVLEISPDDAQAKTLRDLVKPPEPAAPAGPGAK